MSNRRIQDLSVAKGSLKSASRSRPIRQAPITNIEEQQLTHEQALMNLPAVRPLMAVPGIEPFIRSQLVPDLIDMYQWAGITHVIKTLELVDAEQTPEELVEELVETYAYSGLQGLTDSIQEIDPETDVSGLEALITEGGVTSLTELVATTTPETIVYNHPTQKLNKETEKVEIDLIKNEPDVAERFDISPCESCGSRKIKPLPRQTRSGDEAWSLFALCVSCKHEWRFG